MRDILYTCNLCSSCQEQCYEVKQTPAHPRLRADARAGRARKAGAPCRSTRPWPRSLEKNDNPWGLPKKKRGDWAKGLPLKNLNKESAEVLFFAGAPTPRIPPCSSRCAPPPWPWWKAEWTWAPWEPRSSAAAPPCCRWATATIFETFAYENIEKFNSLGVKTIVAPCSHCAWVFKEEYAGPARPTSR